MIITCQQCKGNGEVITHLPSKDKMMFGLLDFGISTVVESLKGRKIDCSECNGYGYVVVNN